MTTEIANHRPNGVRITGRPSLQMVLMDRKTSFRGKDIPYMSASGVKKATNKNDVNPLTELTIKQIPSQKGRQNVNGEDSGALEIDCGIATSNE